MIEILVPGEDMDYSEVSEDAAAAKIWPEDDDFF